MTPEQFCFWLSGRIEATQSAVPSDADWALIQEKLNAALERASLRQGMPVPMPMSMRPGL